ncbi:MAG: nucleotidyl transferase AbiEii/AbiGii toxin family protein [Chloroflexota bacterium]
MNLPPLPNRQILSDACHQEAAHQGFDALVVEKDFHLTRLIWALAQERGQQLLLKGGTCLSKCDLGCHRMSEDADFVIPWPFSTNYRRKNAPEMDKVRDALKAIASEVGVMLRSDNRSTQASYGTWTVAYPSELVPGGEGRISIEATMGPTLRQARQAPLRCILTGPLMPAYAAASCWALDAAEVRAEKVRAAYTREDPAIRDFYDLDLFRQVEVDMSSGDFRGLVDAKLGELGQRPLAEQAPQFGLTPRAKQRLARDIPRQLSPMLRSGDPPYDLDRTLRHYDELWGHERRAAPE